MSNSKNLFLPEGFIINEPFVREYTSSDEKIEEAAEKRIILEGTAVRCDDGRSLHVRMPGGLTGIIPKSECVYDVSDKSKEIAVIYRVGKAVCFTVDGIYDGNIYLSRKAAQKMCVDEYISYLAPGDITDAVITHMEPFGAFCDIGCGNISLLPIDSMSVSRISHPKDRFFVSERIKAVVKTHTDCDGRITLTHKELLGTWSENASLFMPGEAVTGVVRSIEQYGIFVELLPNLAGLAEYKDGISIGDRVSVYIKSIIPSKMKVKLVIIDKVPNYIGNSGKNEYKYYINGSHIDRFVYSPEESEKLIESAFE